MTPREGPFRLLALLSEIAEIAKFAFGVLGEFRAGLFRAVFFGGVVARLKRSPVIAQHFGPQLIGNRGSGKIIPLHAVGTVIIDPKRSRRLRSLRPISDLIRIGGKRSLLVAI